MVQVELDNTAAHDINDHDECTFGGATAAAYELGTSDWGVSFPENTPAAPFTPRTIQLRIATDSQPGTEPLRIGAIRIYPISGCDFHYVDGCWAGDTDCACGGRDWVCGTYQSDCTPDY